MCVSEEEHACVGTDLLHGLLHTCSHDVGDTHFIRCRAFSGGAFPDALRSNLRLRSGRGVVLAVVDIVVVLGLMGVVGGNVV